MSKSRKQSVRVLFVGNSFTQRNDLPGLIVQLAAARGLTIEHKLLSIGGASLRTHWNKGEASAAIKSGKFKYVVVQEQSTLPIKNAARMRENVLLFDETIRSAGGKTVLYMTWARKNTPEKQREITDAYESIGREIKAVVVPVGIAWERFISKHDSPVLHDRDQSHPTLAGSYLAACVFLGMLFGESAVGIKSNPASLSDDDARLLQGAGRDTVLGTVLTLAVSHARPSLADRAIENFREPDASLFKPLLNHRLGALDVLLVQLWGIPIGRNSFVGDVDGNAVRFVGPIFRRSL